MSCSLMTATFVGLKARFHADHGQHGLVARRRLHRAPGVDAGEVERACGRAASLPMRSREPSLHSAITTFLRCACSASDMGDDGLRTR